MDVAGVALASIISQYLSAFLVVFALFKIKNDNTYNYVEEAFTDKIGNRVKIKNKKIVIPFNSEKDLERILEILKVEVNVD